MVRNLFWLALAFSATALASVSEGESPGFQPLKPTQQQATAAHLTAKIIGEHHYKPVSLNDELSQKVFDGYLKALDPDHLFFIQEDIDQFKDARTKLDDAILTENLELPFAIFNLYAKRSVERFNYARSLLKTGFDFQQKETYQYNRENAAWPKNEDEAKELWRKRVKNDWLQLKLAGKDDKKIAETLDKRYDNFIKRMQKLKNDDGLQIFMNAYTMAIDPHTNYMVPKTSENFDISMRLSLVGIGAVLEDKDNYTTIKELVPGGPAALSEKLQPGDRILGVAQAENEPFTDVVGWRLDDTVALIRGKMDTVVVLDVLPADANPDAEHKKVTMIRKKISLEDQAAKKSVIDLREKGLPYKVGVISLPTFYEDFEARRRGDADYKSASRDVSKLLTELKAEKVDAVLIDLRNNGGGSLTEAIELTSLFVGSGPVVQQRDASGDVSVSKGNALGVMWDGPLGVLINRGSASASEIFAAAIQDYRRGLVMGETSFGKGTVQTMVDLDKITHNPNHELGELKLTVAQFFRINGGTTQLRGVTPDFTLPSASDTEHFGESSYDSALPWMQIKPADYQQSATDIQGLVPKLQQKHDERVVSDLDYQYLVEDINELTEQRKKNELSLNEAERRKEKETRDAKLKARKKDDKPEEGKEADKTTTDAHQNTAIDKDLDDDEPKKKDKNAKDVLLQEAAFTLGDEVEILKSSRKAGKSAGKSKKP